MRSPKLFQTWRNRWRLLVLVSPDPARTMRLSRTAERLNADCCALALLPDNVLPSVFRQLSRTDILELTLVSHDLRCRVIALLSHERTSTAIGFERRLCMPSTLQGGVHELMDRLNRFGRRFAGWSLCLVVREESGSGYLHCSGLPACGPDGVLASISTCNFGVDLAGTRHCGWQLSFWASMQCADVCVGVQLVGSVLRVQHLWRKPYRQSRRSRHLTSKVRCCLPPGFEQVQRVFYGWARMA
jgi:hypothetical protein